MAKKNSNTLKIVLVLAVLCSFSFCSDFTWQKKKSMPEKRLRFGAAEVSGKIYVFGGYNEEKEGVVSKFSETVYEYDPTADTWTSKAAMPEPRAGFSVAVVNKKIYVIGGRDQNFQLIAAVDEYNPASDTWELKADIPTPRTSLKVCAVNGKIYAFGGLTQTSAFVSALEVFDPASDTWEEKASMLTERWRHNVIAVSNKIYVIGGISAGGIGVTTVEEYNTGNDYWGSKVDMTSGRESLGLAVLGKKIYAFGGFSGAPELKYGQLNFNNLQGKCLKVVEEYDPEKDTWTEKKELPAPKKAFEVVAVGNKVYVFGGADDLGAVNTVFEGVFK